MYTKDQINNIIRQNIKIRGKDWCLLKLAEECNELATAIMQYLTKDNLETNIQKEMADVKIALKALKIIYGNRIINDGIQNKIEKIDRKNEELKNDTTRKIFRINSMAGKHNNNAYKE